MMGLLRVFGFCNNKCKEPVLAGKIDVIEGVVTPGGQEVHFLADNATMENTVIMAAMMGRKSGMFMLFPRYYNRKFYDGQPSIYMQNAYNPETDKTGPAIYVTSHDASDTALEYKIVTYTYTEE